VRRLSFAALWCCDFHMELPALMQRVEGHLFPALRELTSGDHFDTFHAPQLHQLLSRVLSPSLGLLHLGISFSSPLASLVLGEAAQTCPMLSELHLVGNSLLIDCHPPPEVNPISQCLNHLPGLSGLKKMVVQDRFLHRIYWPYFADLRSLESLVILGTDTPVNWNRLFHRAPRFPPVASLELRGVGQMELLRLFENACVLATVKHLSVLPDRGEPSLCAHRTQDLLKSIGQHGGQLEDLALAECMLDSRGAETLLASPLSKLWLTSCGMSREGKAVLENRVPPLEWTSTQRYKPDPQAEVKHALPPLSDGWSPDPAPQEAQRWPQARTPTPDEVNANVSLYIGRCRAWLQHEGFVMAEVDDNEEGSVASEPEQEGNMISGSEGEDTDHEPPTGGETEG